MVRFIADSHDRSPLNSGRKEVLYGTEQGVVGQLLADMQSLKTGWQIRDPSRRSEVQACCPAVHTAAASRLAFSQASGPHMPVLPCSHSTAWSAQRPVHPLSVKIPAQAVLPQHWRTQWLLHARRSSACHILINVSESVSSIQGGFLTSPTTQVRGADMPHGRPARQGACPPCRTTPIHLGLTVPHCRCCPGCTECCPGLTATLTQV